jgi:ABC-type multidrug transport system permease subunit
VTLSALGFAALVWGSLALVAVVFLYELLTVWRDWKEPAVESP